jgi:lysyl-tRNA synthetase class 2
MQKMQAAPKMAAMSEQEERFRPFPARSRRQKPIDRISKGKQAWISGRLVVEEGEVLVLRDASGSIPVEIESNVAVRGRSGECGGASPGDLVDLLGCLEEGIFRVQEVVRLAPGRRFPGPDSANSVLWKTGAEPFIRKSRLRSAVRAYFEERGFLEVETPSLLPAGGQEPHLNPFRTKVETAGGKVDAYLITSPEYCHKRLLAAGHENIFELARVFRNGSEEGRDQHWYEFTMLEWYRAYASYEEIMADSENLVFYSAATLGADGADRFRPPFRRLTMADAFGELAGIDLAPYLDGKGEDFARREAEDGRFGLVREDAPDARFFKILVAAVEPALRDRGPVFIVDYPASQAALSKIREDDPRVCERFELYIDGVELANGFTELNDPAEQRRRFEEDARIKAAGGLDAVPVDEAFLEALELGMPPAGGAALGVDRLAMVLFGEKSFDAFLPFGRFF